MFTAHPDLLSDPLAGVAADPLAMADLIGLLRRRALARLGLTASRWRTGWWDCC